MTAKSNPLAHAEVIAALCIRNLVKLERRVRSELIRAQGIAGNGEMVNKLENDLRQLQAENQAVANLLATHLTHMIAFDAIAKEAQKVQVSLRSESMAFDVFYEMEAGDVPVGL